MNQVLNVMLAVVIGASSVVGAVVWMFNGVGALSLVALMLLSVYAIEKISDEELYKAIKRSNSK